MSVIEKFGIYFDEVGLSKTYGRMFGIFMTAKEPVSMGKLVSELRISKSTASTELRRLLAMGVIEKVLMADQRTTFYQLKKNIWQVNLLQKIQEIKKLQAIVEEIPAGELETLKNLKEMGDYCVFIEAELKILVEKYLRSGKSSGSYVEGNFIVEWSKLPAVSDAFHEKMRSLADLGIEAFREIEIDFLRSHPGAVEEDKNLAPFSGLQAAELEAAMNAKLEKIFHMHPKELGAAMADIYYYIVTIRDAQSEKIQGFITFMSGRSKNECKITILAVDKNVRRTGLASLLVNSLTKIGVEYKRLLVSTRPSNAAAINAYKKWGFREEALKSSPPHFVPGHWVHLARYL